MIARRVAARLSPRAVRWLGAGAIAVIILIILPLCTPDVIASLSPADLASTSYSQGYFLPQTDDMGHSYVWSEPHATTAFTFAGRRPFDLVLTLRSAAVAGGPDAPVIVVIDGQQTQTLHLDPTSPRFQTVRVPVHATHGRVLSIGLQSATFMPKGDQRTLGTLVQAVAIDRSGSWSSLTHRHYLYLWVWLAGMVVGACMALLPIVRRAAPPRTQLIVAVQTVSLAASLSAAAAMIAAIALLLRIGQIDELRYPIWLFGTLYVAGYFLTVALHIPLGGREARSVWRRWCAIAQSRRWGALNGAIGYGTAFGATTLLALYFLAFPGAGDVDDKLRWMRNIAAHGLVGGFQVSRDDYPPGTYVVLAALTKIAPLLGAGSLVTYKLSILAFLLASGLIMWWWTRNAPLAIALQLALVADSMVLGYNDAYFVAPLLLALWALRARRLVWFSVLFTVTCLMKWQPLILAPVVVIYILATMTTREHRARDLRRLALTVVLPAAAILFANALIFGPEFVAVLHRATSEHFLSADALNFHWLVTQALAAWQPHRFTFGQDTHRRYIIVQNATLLTFLKVPYALIYLGILFWFIRERKTFTTMLLYAYSGYIAYFLFNTSVHENHLVPAVVLGGVLWAMNRRYWPLFVGAALMLNINLLLFYRLDGYTRLPVLVKGVDFSWPLACINVALFVVLLARGLRSVVFAGGVDD